MEPLNDDKPLTLAEAREGNFEFGLDVTAARELQAELDAANKRTDDAEERVAAGLEKLGYPRTGGPEDADMFDKALFALSGVSQDRNAEKKRADDAEAALKVALDKAAKAKAPATAKPTTPRARKVTEMPPADRASLTALLQFPGPFEIVPAHDGKEVTTLHPVEVTGDQFTYAGGLHRLTSAVTYQPDVSSVVDGFGLFGTDGKQVAWMPLPDPVTIAARQTVSFADAIGFASQSAEG